MWNSINYGVVFGFGFGGRDGFTLPPAFALQKPPPSTEGGYGGKIHSTEGAKLIEAHYLTECASKFLLFLFGAEDGTEKVNEHYRDNDSGSNNEHTEPALNKNRNRI